MCVVLFFACWLRVQNAKIRCFRYALVVRVIFYTEIYITVYVLNCVGYFFYILILLTVNYEMVKPTFRNYPKHFINICHPDNNESILTMDLTKVV